MSSGKTSSVVLLIVTFLSAISISIIPFFMPCLTAFVTRFSATRFIDSISAFKVQLPSNVTTIFFLCIDTSLSSTTFLKSSAISTLSSFSLFRRFPVSSLSISSICSIIPFILRTFSDIASAYCCLLSVCTFARRFSA